MISSRTCPVCNTPADKATLFLGENISPEKISSFSFASRKLPEYMCHHMVRCSVCDLVYADMPPQEEELAESYHAASYDSSEEADDAAKSYILAIQPALAHLRNRESALEIGTGTGVFLEHLKSAGFTTLVGVEPSTAAIAAAPAHRRSWIREGMFDESDFLPGSFDLICCFMTMEHVGDPMEIAKSALRLLRPGGVFLTVTHDYTSTVNRFLGKRSPIVDIEHLQIFSRRSIRELYARAGFGNISVESFINRYSLRYWLRLSPLPGFLKSSLERMISSSNLGSGRLGINVGNMIAAGFREM
jgi:SAM-dependent methyltransferase